MRSELARAPKLGWREVELSGSDRTGRSGNSNAQYEKDKASGADEVLLEIIGDG